MDLATQFIKERQWLLKRFVLIQVLAAQVLEK